MKCRLISLLFKQTLCCASHKRTRTRTTQKDTNKQEENCLLNSDDDLDLVLRNEKVDDDEKRRGEERKRNKKRVIRRWYRAHRGTSFVYNTSVERLSAIQCAPSPSPFYSRRVLREWLTKLLPHSSSHSRVPLPPLLMSMTSMPPPPQ